MGGKQSNERDFRTEKTKSREEPRGDEDSLRLTLKLCHLRTTTRVDLGSRAPNNETNIIFHYESTGNGSLVVSCEKSFTLGSQRFRIKSHINERELAASWRHSMHHDGLKTKKFWPIDCMLRIGKIFAVFFTRFKN